MDLEKWQNLGYLFWAYTFFWALVAGYLVLITRRMSRETPAGSVMSRTGSP
mgnify:CR=1 FL=1